MRTLATSLIQQMPMLVMASVSQFFSNLLNQGLTPMALAAATFFFAWAAVLYMSAGTEIRAESSKLKERSMPPLLV